MRGTRGRIAAVMGVSFVCSLALSLPVSTANGAESLTHEWEVFDGGAKSFELKPASVRISAIESGEYERFSLIEVRSPSLAHPVKFEVDGYSGSLAVVPLSRDGRGVQLVVKAYEGGAGCCTTVHVVDLSRRVSHAMLVGTFDGEGPDIEDVDGDGLIEIVTQDERFRSLGSTRWERQPSRIFGVSDGVLQDVTRDPAFRKHHASIWAMQSEACSRAARETPGACAVYLGTAALLGKLKPSLGRLEFRTPANGGDANVPYRICRDEGCAEEREFEDFRQALFYALDAWGYSDGPYAR